MSRALASVAVLVCAACASKGSPAIGPSHDAGALPVPGAADAVAEAGMVCPIAEETSGPEVSFTADLMPFFGVTCAFGGCHDGDTREAGLYLGPNVSKGPADVATQREVYESLLSPATTTTDVPRIAPYEPGRSFLMLKVESCQNALGLTCGDRIPDEPCGARMPYLSEPLATEKRAMLARWIAEGARFSVSD